jgi:acetyl-CoA acyltransferase 1
VQAIATIAGQIQMGSIDIGIGAGVESMSMKSMTDVDLKVRSCPTHPH